MTLTIGNIALLLSLCGTAITISVVVSRQMFNSNVKAQCQSAFSKTEDRIDALEDKTGQTYTSLVVLVESFKQVKDAVERLEQSLKEKSVQTLKRK